MEKKYQVFVSSTYEDLKEERLAVINCLLDHNCIPVGMEQFPASDLSQWEYIKKMMKYTDYYVLITAGKYGTIDKNSNKNLSYTEEEYDYAKEHNIPILSFIIDKSVDLPASKIERNPRLVKMLENFQKKAMDGKMVDFYKNIDHLKYCVSKSISNAINNIEAVGWVRGDAIIKTTDNQHIDEKLARLEQKIQERPIIKTGTAAPTTATCPAGSLYGQYE